MLTTWTKAAGSYNLIFGVGFALHNLLKKQRKNIQDLNYVLIDDVIKDQKNVSIVWLLPIMKQVTLLV